MNVTLNLWYPGMLNPPLARTFNPWVTTADPALELLARLQGVAWHAGQ